MKAWPILGISIVAVILLLAHSFLFFTWIHFWDAPSPSDVYAMRAAMLVLAFSFVFASLLSFRFSNPLVAFVYKLAATWLGFLNFFFWAACLCWLAWFALAITGMHLSAAAARAVIAYVLFGAALLAGIYGIVNARVIRTRRFALALPGLPESWRGRRAVMLSDLHLGNINRTGFARRMTAMVSALKPDIVFIPGDLFDGTKADLDELVAPFKELAPAFGTWFSTGNHEEFRDTGQYLAAVARAGIRVLKNEVVNVDGLHVAGVEFGDTVNPMRLKAVLDGMKLDASKATILLNHMPSRLPVVERAGVSLQLSGHTHGGQFAPFNWITSFIFGRFTHGLHKFGSMQVYTSTGAGTWGPPMRVGTQPEIVSIEFI